MTGRTGYTPPNNGLAPLGPDQMTAIYQHFDALVGETKALISDLPASGNWPGRMIFVQEDQSVRLWDGSAWIRVAGTLPTYSGRLASTVSLLNNALTVVPDYSDVVNVGGFSETAGAVTLPVTGEYAIDVNAYTVGAGATHFVALLLNGTASTDRIAGAEGGQALSLSVHRKLPAGSVLRVQAYQNSGSTRTLSDIAGGATLPFINVRYLGPA